MDMRRVRPNLISTVIAALLFSLLVNGVAVSANAQSMPNMTVVSGSYTNAEAGVEVVFPEGWEGIEFTAEGVLSVSTTPGGFSDQIPTKFIALGVVSKAVAEQQNKDPREASAYETESGVECSTPSMHTIRLSGKTAYEVTVECTYPDGNVHKSKSVIAQTETKWISLTYTSVGSDFASDEAKFDAAVTTLKIQGAIDAEVQSNLGQELKSAIHSVLVKGKNVDLALTTTSTISNFKLEEENKMISFSVEGKTGTQGSTRLPIGKILEGPYVVTVDGQETNDFQVTNEGTSEAMMEISYTHSVHEITVSGTNVVPEFPVVAIGAIAAIIGVVAIIGRFSPLSFRP
jgi:hypothetical protein